MSRHIFSIQSDPLRFYSKLSISPLRFCCINLAMIKVLSIFNFIKTLFVCWEHYTFYCARLNFVTLFVQFILSARRVKLSHDSMWARAQKALPYWAKWKNRNFCSPHNRRDLKKKKSECQKLTHIKWNSWSGNHLRLKLKIIWPDRATNLIPQFQK